MFTLWWIGIKWVAGGQGEFPSSRILSGCMAELLWFMINGKRFYWTQYYFVEDCLNSAEAVQ